ncbi:MAG: signal peptidase II [Planctomycetota bacterium]
MKRPAAIGLYLTVAAALVCLDLWSKEAVFRLLEAEVIPGEPGPPRLSSGPPWVLFEGLLALEAAINLGAFNGMLSSVPWILQGVSAVAVAATLLLVALPARFSPLLTVAFGLIAGGAIGNLHDRFTHGAVRDFIKVYYRDWVWPNFNAADSAICVGVGLILLRELTLWRRARRAGDPAGPEADPPQESPGAP